MLSHTDILRTESLLGIDVARTLLYNNPNNKKNENYYDINPRTLLRLLRQNEHESADSCNFFYNGSESDESIIDFMSRLKILEIVYKVLDDKGLELT